MKKGAISFLVVFVFIGIILISISSYSLINFQYEETLALENNYYKSQDIKHSIVLASKKGAEEGLLIYIVKQEIWKECVNQTCGESALICPPCGPEPSLKEEVRNRVIDHLSSLNSYYEQDERYSIKLWCGDATQGQLSDLGWSMKSNKRARIYSTEIENCYEYISIYTNIYGTITVRFEKEELQIPNTHKIIGISLYDPYTDISTVSFIPNTEEFDILWDS